ncbi:MAG: hypothetical protein MEQ84_05485 [Mesorhizobium sp.]|nr:hypothetical protein [Mesorhizobium sp.]
MDAKLAGALQEIARAAPAGREDWWIIGSAALVLAGVEGVEPADVDLFGSAETLSLFLDNWQEQPAAPKPGTRFRSDPYLRVDRPECLPIETMGDLEVLSQRGWQKVLPTTRLAVEIDDLPVFIPALDEQLAILRLFGREKDLAKIRLVETAI